MSLFNDEGLLGLGSLRSFFVSILGSFGFEPIRGSVFNHSLFLCVVCAPSVENTKICSFTFQLSKNFVQHSANDL